jgi:hypothetical protein
MKDCIQREDEERRYQDFRAKALEAATVAFVNGQLVYEFESFSQVVQRFYHYIVTGEEQ